MFPFKKRNWLRFFLFGYGLVTLFLNRLRFGYAFKCCKLLILNLVTLFFIFLGK